MGKYDRVVPLDNFRWARNADGTSNYGFGAWELLYRYSFVDLTDGAVQGGTYGEHTVGLNWYWNPNIKLQMNYIYGQRSAPAPAAGGQVQGFAIRAALEF